MSEESSSIMSEQVTPPDPRDSVLSQQVTERLEVVSNALHRLQREAELLKAARCALSLGEAPLVVWARLTTVAGGQFALYEMPIDGGLRAVESQR